MPHAGSRLCNCLILQSRTQSFLLQSIHEGSLPKLPLGQFLFPCLRVGLQASIGLVQIAEEFVAATLFDAFELGQSRKVALDRKLIGMLGLSMDL